MKSVHRAGLKAANLHGDLNAVLAGGLEGRTAGGLGVLGGRQLRHRLAGLVDDGRDGRRTAGEQGQARAKGGPGAIAIDVFRLLEHLSVLSVGACKVTRAKNIGMPRKANIAAVILPELQWRTAPVRR